MKKVLKFFAFLIGLVLISMLVLPIILKDQIQTLVMRELNNQVNAEVSLEDIDLTLFSRFPNLSVRLNGLSIVNQAPFEGVKLLDAQEIHLEIDLFSAISGNTFLVEGIDVNDVYVDVQVLEDGIANYDILVDTSASPEREEAMPEEVSPKEASFNLVLSHYGLKNFNLKYNDLEGEMSTEIVGLNHQGNGRFSESDMHLKTKTSIESLSFIMEEIAYLDKVKTTADIAFDFFPEETRIEFAENSLFLNDLELKFQGGFSMDDDKMVFDLKYNTPNSSLKSLLSLIPAFFMEGFESLEAGGDFSFNGDFIGEMPWEGESMPGFEINTLIHQGFIKYPDLPSSISNIELDFHLLHPKNTDLNSLKFVLNDFQAKVLESKLSGKMVVSDLMTDPNVDMNVSAHLDFEKVLSALKMNEYDISGRLDGDLLLKGRVSAFENDKYDAVQAEGKLDLTDFVYQDPEFSLPVEIPLLNAALSPKDFHLNKFKMKIGQSDFVGTGSLTNLTSYMLLDSTLSGDFNFSSSLIEGNELSAFMIEDTLSGDANASKPQISDSTTTMSVVYVPENLNVGMTLNAKKLVYDTYTLDNLKGNLKVHNGMVDLNGVQMGLFGGKVKLDGIYEATPTVKPNAEMRFALENMPFKQTFTEITMLKKFAPLLAEANGSFGLKMDYASLINEEMGPDLNTVQGKGVLTTKSLNINSSSTQKLAEAFKNPKLAKMKLDDANLSFKIEDGRIHLKETPIKVGSYKATFVGSNGLDQSLDYEIKTSLPLKEIKAAGALRDLGLKTGDVPVVVLVGGTFDKPTFKPSFGDVSKSLEEEVKKAISKELEKQKQKLIEDANKEAERLIAEAEKKGDELIKEAEKSAKKLEDEAKIQGENLKAEAKRQANKIRKEGKGNPLKMAAAEKLAQETEKEADRQAKKLQETARMKGKQLVDIAKVEKKKLIEAAKENAQITQ